MYSESEVLNLLMGIVSLLVFWKSTKMQIERLRNFYLGFICMVCSYFFTVAEGYLYHNFFDSLEHLSFALAGMAFAVASHEMFTESGGHKHSLIESDATEQELCEVA